MRWLPVYEAPCQWCAVWIGPHRHSVRPDGTLGNVVEFLAEDGQVLADPTPCWRCRTLKGRAEVACLMQPGETDSDVNPSFICRPCWEAVGRDKGWLEEAAYDLAEGAVRRLTEEARL